MAMAMTLSFPDMETVVSWLQQTWIFHNFPYGGNAIIRKPRYLWVLPPWLSTMIYHGTSSSSRVVGIGLIPLDVGFWASTFVLLLIQTWMNVMVAMLTFRYIVQQPTASTRYLLCYGILIPIFVSLPPMLYSVINFDNVALMLCLCGAIPVLMTLRVLQATHEQLPAYAAQNMTNLMLYFASPLQIQFDSMTQHPVLLTRTMAWTKFKAFVLVFVQTSFLYSLLLPNNYRVCTPQPISLYTLWNLYNVRNLVNGFLMASLTSLVLDGGASGLGLIMSLLSGLAMEDFSRSPLSQSTSPSDFWSYRWDRPVQDAIRRGCFQPLKTVAKMTPLGAAWTTFWISGLLHEYIMWIMSFRQPTLPHQPPYQPYVGSQWAFFIWNGIVLLLERWLMKQKKEMTTTKKDTKTSQQPLSVVFWLLDTIQQYLPQSCQTALVLLTVLPVAHWFTNEYIRSGFYSDAAWGFPLFVLVMENNDNKPL